MLFLTLPIINLTTSVTIFFETSYCNYNIFLFLLDYERFLNLHRKSRIFVKNAFAFAN